MCACVRACSCCCAWLKESNDFKYRPQSDPRLHTADVDVFCLFIYLFFFFILPISSVEQITRDRRVLLMESHRVGCSPPTCRQYREFVAVVHLMPIVVTWMGGIALPPPACPPLNSLANTIAALGPRVARPLLL